MVRFIDKIVMNNIQFLTTIKILLLFTLMGFLCCMDTYSQTKVSQGSTDDLRTTHNPNNFVSPMIISHPLKELMATDPIDNDGIWSAGYFRTYICDNVHIDHFMIGRVQKRNWPRPKLSVWAVLRTDPPRDKTVDLRLDIFLKDEWMCGTTIDHIDAEEKKNKKVKAVFSYPQGLFSGNSIPLLKITMIVRDNG